MKLTCICLFLVASGYTNTISPSENKESDLTGTLTHIKEAPYMAIIRVKNDHNAFAAAAIITKRHLITRAIFLIRHKAKDTEVITGTNIATTRLAPNAYEVKKFSTERRIGIIKLKTSIVFNELQKPIALLKRNVLNLNLLLGLREGTEKMKLIGYENIFFKKIDKFENILTSLSFYKKMNIEDLTKLTFKIDKPNLLAYNHSGAFLIIRAQLAGVATSGEKGPELNEDFAAIPNYFSWIYQVVGYQNLQEAFHDIYLE